MKILITGGAGFIGSAVVRQYITETEYEIINLDALTYAGNLESLASVDNNPRYHFEHADICNPQDINRIFEKHQPDAIMHLAAESHVDRSISGPAAFIQTNIIGTYNLLETAKKYWLTLSGEKKQNFRFHHVSTDEVYGDLEQTGFFTEETPYEPSSPYSASKASSDHLVRAWYRTYGLPVLVTNCSNNYGAHQFPEKLIPLVIINALIGKDIPVYGTGKQVRDWLYVDDHAEALRLVLEKGVIGETYNIGGYNEKTNLEVVKTICALLDEIKPDSRYKPHEQLIKFVSDRPGHDLRYAIDATKITQKLNWKPKNTFEEGIRKTVLWYLENESWLNNVISGAYRDWIERHYG